MKKKKTLLFLFLLVNLLPLNLAAVSFEKADRIDITNLHRLNDDLYAFGSNITVNGEIDGDFIAGGYDVSVLGNVTGSQSVWAYTFRHAGRSGGAVRAFAYTVTIDGYVGRSLLAAGYLIKVGQGAVIAKDVRVRGSVAYVEGTVSGNLDFRGERIYLSGFVNGDVNIDAESISLTPPAVINGAFRYRSDTEINFDTLAGVTILGQKERLQPEPEPPASDRQGLSTPIVLALSKLLAAFLFGIVFVMVFRKYAAETFTQLRTRFPVAVASGLLGSLVTVLCLILLVVSAVLFLIGWNMAKGDLAVLGAIFLVFSIVAVPIFTFATVSGGLLLYSGKVMLAFLIGYWLMRTVKRSPVALGKTQLLVGLVILSALFWLPYVGIVFYIAACIIGAGGIILGIRLCRHEMPPNSVSPPQQSTGR
jgi:cytoskeletal protein CcmA (bactofilin family)